MSTPPVISLSGLTDGASLHLALVAKDAASHTVTEVLSGSSDNDLQAVMSRLSSSAPSFDSAVLAVPLGFPENEIQRVTAAAAAAGLTIAYTMDYARIYCAFLPRDIAQESTILFIQVGSSASTSQLLITKMDLQDELRDTSTEGQADAPSGLAAEELIRRLVDPLIRPGLDTIVLLDADAPSALVADVEHLLHERHPDIALHTFTPSKIAITAASLPPSAPPYSSLLAFNVVPLPIGIVTADGHVALAVARNLTLPTRRSALFTTSRDEQTRVAVQLVLGVGSIRENCLQREIIVLECLHPMPHGVTRIRVSFEIEDNLDTKLTIEQIAQDGAEPLASKVVQLPDLIRNISVEEIDQYARPKDGEITSVEQDVLGELPE